MARSLCAVAAPCGMLPAVVEDFERCYRAMKGRDPCFDGRFVVGVMSTGAYCRPSCPNPTGQRRESLRFYATVAAAQAASLQACARCEPDTAPGSPEWHVRSDPLARAMRLIQDGVVDREGLPGLTRRLAISEGQLRRLLREKLGADPLAIARARRAQTARVLIEHTGLPLDQLALAAGFSSVRQFDETAQSVLGAPLSELRRSTRARGDGRLERISIPLPVRTPFCGPALLSFLGERAIPGVEEVRDGVFRRVLALPASLGVVELAPADTHVQCTLRLDAVSDLGAAVERCRRLLDLDADPHAVDETLGADPLLRGLVQRRPGLRSSGTVDGFEVAVRAILGQQISVRAARTQAGRLAETLGRPLSEPDGGLVRAFPSPEAIASAPDAAFPMPRTRRDALRAVAAAVASGELVLDAGAEREETVRQLLAMRGIGPWTAAYVSMRALGDPDVLLGGDLGVRKALERLNGGERLRGSSERWRPWRSYATHHLWASLAGPTGP